MRESIFFWNLRIDSDSMTYLSYMYEKEETETHVNNEKLQRLFKAKGFQLSDPQQGKFPFIILTKELAA